MRAVIQRVSSATVRTADGESATIGRGLLVLVSVGRDDGPEDCRWLAEKITKLRIFPGADVGIGAERSPGQMERSVLDADGNVLVVSQFTLHGSVRKGSRPSFNDAARPEVAQPLYEEFVLQLQTAMGHRVETGRFGAMMQVELINDGPVTILIDTQSRG